MTARFGAVHVDLTRCADHRDQLATVAAAMAGTPRGTLCRITLGRNTANPPEGWLSHRDGIMRPGHLYELHGHAERCASWLAQYRAETAQARA